MCLAACGSVQDCNSEMWFGNVFGDFNINLSDLGTLKDCNSEIWFGNVVFWAMIVTCVVAACSPLQNAGPVVQFLIP